MSFLDAFAYTPAYLPVISALACTDNPLPMPTTVHGLRGQLYVRHRDPLAGIPDESRRRLVKARRCRYVEVNITARAVVIRPRMELHDDRPPAL
ncbi:hypothetical protein EII10_03975 [Actinomyces bowdenii]|uniref:Uncharacterized protein n=1 Tax=Actinomyces bowdenii TaxID=131109 RepID=A0A3P1V7Q3_9ACTO|nr:hypothetical protein EII10_03975 [Actinomyces bowdenii]